MKKTEHIHQFARLAYCLLALLLIGGSTSKVYAITPAGTVITSQAYADYSDDNGNARPRVFSNTVDTIVLAVAGVSVTPEAAAIAGQAAADAVQSFTVLNLGNDTDTYTVAFSSDVGWPAQLIVDANANGILDDDESTIVTVPTGDIPAGGQLSLHLVVSVPADVVDGTAGIYTVNATSALDNTVVDSGIYTFNIQSAVPTLEKSIVETTTFAPGDVVTYRLIASNSGSAPVDNIVITDDIPANMTYLPNSLRAGSASATYATATPLTDTDTDSDDGDFNLSLAGAATFGNSTQPSIPAGAAGQAYFFQATIDDGVAAGTTISNTGYAVYKTGDTVLPNIDSNIVNFTVDAKAGVSLEEDKGQLVEPGEAVTYELTVINTGNSSGTFNMSDQSTIGLNWIWFYAPSTDSSAAPASPVGLPLTDTNADGIVDTGPMDSGVSIKIVCVTTIPSGVDDGLQDITTATATSIEDATVSDLVTLTTTVQAPVINMVKSVLPTGTQAPGTVLTYTVITTNSGSGVARDLIINDPIPQWTDYVPSTIKTSLSGGPLTARTDADDGDGGTYDASLNDAIADSVDLGPGGSATLEFQVQIQ